MVNIHAESNVQDHLNQAKRLYDDVAATYDTKEHKAKIAVCTKN